MGFTPSKAEADIWMRENNDLYEYIAVYVDDLLVTARDPNHILQTLQEQHKFKLKGVGPLMYHLGWYTVIMRNYYQSMHQNQLERQ